MHYLKREIRRQVRHRLVSLMRAASSLFVRLNKFVAGALIAGLSASLIVFSQAASTPAQSHGQDVGDWERGLHQPFKYEFSSKHFTFYSVDDTKFSKLYADYLEDFLLILKANYVSIPENFHLTYYLYPDRTTLNMEGCSRPPKRRLEGRYVQSRDVVFSYDTCGIGTLSHELVHKIVHENFKNPEDWAKEGIPTFFENIYGYRGQSGPVLYVGFQSPWRTTELGAELSKLTVQSIIDPSASKNPYQESDKRVLSTFLFSEGKLAEYFKVAKSNDHRGYKTLVEAAFQKPTPQIEPRFKAYVAELSANKSRLLLLPNSAYFSCKADFDKFFHEHERAFTAKPSLTPEKMKLVAN